MIIASVIFNAYFRQPLGANNIDMSVDYLRIAVLSSGIFFGVLSSQVYDRYVKKQKELIKKSDFFLGALASVIMTSFLFEKILSINDAQIIFFFSFQNGFIFTTVIDKLKSQN